MNYSKVILLINLSLFIACLADEEEIIDNHGIALRPGNKSFKRIN
jgi:hypothetical protein